MNSFVEIKKTERKFEEIESIDIVLNILKENIKDATFYVKNDIDRNVVKINHIADDKSITIITDPNYTPVNNRLTTYSLLDRYFEMDLNVIEVKGPGYFKCNINSAKRAAAVRKDLRLKVKPEQVIATNFIVSKHTIDLSGYKIPTSIKVLLDQFHSEHSNLSDIFKVDVFEQNNSLLERIKKAGKILFIEDLNNPDTYGYSDNDIINTHELMEDLLPEYMKKNSEKGYKSIIIAPIIYITDSGQSVSFAYAQLISKSKIFSLEDVHEIKRLLNVLVNRIKDSNALTIHINQQIIDLSKSGAKLYITDENLKKYLINNKGFLFNIVFKLQAPVTIYGEIKNIYRDREDNLFVGIAFAGHSSRKNEMKRYYSYIDPMIKAYKERLLHHRRKMGTKKN